METTIETTLKPDTDETLDAIPVTPLSAAENEQESSSDTAAVSPAPLLRGQQRPTPIGPPIPNHPLAPLLGSFNDEPLWDEWQEAIRVYRQRMNEQQDDEE